MRAQLKPNLIGVRTINTNKAFAIAEAPFSVSSCIFLHSLNVAFYIDLPGKQRRESMSRRVIRLCIIQIKQEYKYSLLHSHSDSAEKPATFVYRKKSRNNLLRARVLANFAQSRYHVVNTHSTEEIKESTY